MQLIEVLLKMFFVSYSIVWALNDWTGPGRVMPETSQSSQVISQLWRFHNKKLCQLIPLLFLNLNLWNEQEEMKE